MDVGVINTLIITAGGLITTYIIYVIAKRRRAENPLETLYEGYEKLIKQLRLEIDRKVERIQFLENNLDVNIKALEQARKELEEARAYVARLQAELDRLKSIVAVPPTN